MLRLQTNLRYACHSRSVVPAGATLDLEFVYDYMSRRCVKRLFEKIGQVAVPATGSPVVEGSTAGVVQPSEVGAAPGGGIVPAPVSWTLKSTYKFVWDGWNLLAELDGNDAVIRTCAWGLDLSGSEQGAGGVGGLLFQHLANTTAVHHLFYDGNGNVTSLRDDAGNLSCEYTYGPFGETLTARGSDAALANNAFKFSTKYADAESGLLYYGYRFYNPGTGRWLNRDPIEEFGGMNVLAFVQNATPNSYDVLGLDEPKLGTDDPTPTVDPGAGVYGSATNFSAASLAERALMMRFHALARQASLLHSVKWPDASRHMNHYLGNTGRPLTIRLERMLKESLAAREHFIRERRIFIEFVNGLDVGNHDVTSGHINGGQHRNVDENWYYAVGGYSAWGKGRAFITCGPDGKKRYAFAFSYKFYDRYNWDNPKIAMVHGVKVHDILFGKLHLYGLAREYDLKGMVTETIRWTEGDPLPGWDTSPFVGPVPGANPNPNPGRRGGR
jgi:RHS repeat-associated protein